MNLICLILVAVCGLPAAAPVVAQGVPRGARVARVTNTTPRMMVANPFVSSAKDSAAAVQIGTALRQGIQDRVGDDYNVVTQTQMNDALLQFGYSPDAILSTTLAVQLAKQIQAFIVVTGTMAKSDDGLYTVTARLAGVNDRAGNVVTLKQQPGERALDLGERVATGLAPAIKVFADAKDCVNEMESRPEKAVKSAEKALKRVPNHGLARFCLFEMAERRKAPREERVVHLEGAVAGDPLSVDAVRRLANEYQAANDTAKTMAAAKQLLRIAPADSEIRKNIFRYMLQVGQPKAAMEVADAGIKVDPLNPDLYDLKADACLYLNDFACTVDALERMYAMDSTRADTLFFAKISAAAARVQPPDTALMVRWSRLGAQKYPDNVKLLNLLNQAYVRTGQIDSSIVVTRQLISRDTTAIQAALAAAHSLAQAGRLEEVGPFYDFVKQYGSAGQRERFASILVPASRQLLQGDTATGKPRDLPGAIDLAKKVIELGDSTKLSLRYGNFILGVALLQQVDELDSRTEAQKSCELAKQQQQMVGESHAALTRVAQANAARPNSPPVNVDQYLTFVEKYTLRVNAMLKAYCE